MINDHFFPFSRLRCFSLKNYYDLKVVSKDFLLSLDSSSDPCNTSFLVLRTENKISFRKQRKQRCSSLNESVVEKHDVIDDSSCKKLSILGTRVKLLEFHFFSLRMRNSKLQNVCEIKWLGSFSFAFQLDRKFGRKSFSTWSSLTFSFHDMSKGKKAN